MGKEEREKNEGDHFEVKKIEMKDCSPGIWVMLANLPNFNFILLKIDICTLLSLRKRN